MMNDRIFKEVDKLRSPERTERLELTKISEIIEQDGNRKFILDIGTGTGLFAEEFSKSNIVVGVDPNNKMIKKAKNYAPDIDFEVASAEALPFEDNSFDIVFFGLVLHEVDDYLKAMKEAYRVTKDKIYILEWRYLTEDFGPPLEHRLKEEFIKELSVQAGIKYFEVIELENLLLYKLTK